MTTNTPVPAAPPYRNCPECLVYESPLAKQFRVLLDGEDVTDRCRYADRTLSVVVLIKRDEGGRVLTSLDAATPDDPYFATSGLVQSETRLGKVEILPNP